MAKTNRAHLTAAVVHDWIDRVGKLPVDQRLTLLTALNNVLAEGTPWQDRRTNALLIVELTAHPELQFTYETHRFPTDYDIEAFRRFMIGLASTGSKLMPSYLRDLRWGILDNNGEGVKTMKAVHAYVARCGTPVVPAIVPTAPVEPNVISVTDMVAALSLRVQDLEQGRIAHASTIGGHTRTLKAHHTRLQALEKETAPALPLQSGYVTPEPEHAAQPGSQSYAAVTHPLTVVRVGCTGVVGS